MLICIAPPHRPLLVIVRLVAHSDLLLPDLPTELAVHRCPHPNHRLGALLLEDTPHVIEERGGGFECQTGWWVWLT